MIRFDKLVIVGLIALSIFSCKEEEEKPVIPTISTYTGPVVDEFWIGDGDIKCGPLTKRFNLSTQQLEIVSNKCNGELNNPKLRFQFFGDTLVTGSYFVNSVSTSNEVSVILEGYNGLDYVASNGLVSTKRHVDDTTKFDFRFTNINLIGSDNNNYKLSGKFLNTK